MESKKEFIEIINWDKAQPLMNGENNPWYKQYTSTLDNEQVIQLDDASYRLLTNIWALAARLNIKDHGNVMRADTAFLKRHIPYLIEHNTEPNLEPLMSVKDMYGRPAPFIRYCAAPAETENSGAGSQDSATNDQRLSTNDKKDVLYEKVVAILGANEFISARALSNEFKITWKRANNIVKSLQNSGLVGEFVQGKGFAVKARAQSEESRVEETIPYRVSEEKKRKNPNGFKNPTAEAQRQRDALLKAEAQDNARKPVNPQNPIDPDESAVVNPLGRTQPTSSFRGGNPQSLGRVIKGDFKPHIADPECREFGEDVADALGLPGQADEVGNFAMWLWELKGMCGLAVVTDELKDYMLSKARWVNSNKCKGKRKKGALLRSIMSSALAKRGLKLPDKRASPAM